MAVNQQDQAAQQATISTPSAGNPFVEEVSAVEVELFDLNADGRLEVAFAIQPLSGGPAIRLAASGVEGENFKQAHPELADVFQLADQKAKEQQQAGGFVPAAPASQDLARALQDPAVSSAIAQAVAAQVAAELDRRGARTGSAASAPPAVAAEVAGSASPAPAAVVAPHGAQTEGTGALDLGALRAAGLSEADIAAVEAERASASQTTTASPTEPTAG